MGKNTNHIEVCMNGAPGDMQCTARVAAHGIPVDRQRRRGLSILVREDNPSKDPKALV